MCRKDPRLAVPVAVITIIITNNSDVREALGNQKSCFVFVFVCLFVLKGV